MSKKIDFSNIDVDKRHEMLVKELVKYKVSANPGVISQKGGVVSLLRELKELRRHIALTPKK